MRQLNTGHYASKFATSWICFGRIFKPLGADLCDFKRQESICTWVKHSAEIFLQFVRLLYSTFTTTAIKSK